MVPAFAGVGVWSMGLRYGDPSDTAAAAAELESLGYSALWIPDTGGDLFGAVEHLLRATSSIIVATGILNLWMHSADETAANHARLIDHYGDRFLLGIGVSHAPVIDRQLEPGLYSTPMERMERFLDELDGAERPVATSDRVLAALGPKMLALGASRAAGIHSYNVTPEHTKRARATLGSEAIVAVELGVVLDPDLEVARAVARRFLATYLTFPNYLNNWRRLGFTDGDFTAGGSDRLVDAVVVCGDEEAISARVQEHRDAGASHVCVQLLNANRDELALREWRALRACTRDPLGR